MRPIRLTTALLRILIALLFVVGATTACGGTKPRSDAFPICGTESDDARVLARSAFEQTRASDYPSAARLYGQAAEIAAGIAPECRHTPVTQSPCPYWESAISTAYMVQDRARLKTSTDGFITCLSHHPTYVPTSDERIMLAIGAHLSHRASPYGLPASATKLKTLLSQAAAQSAPPVE